MSASLILPPLVDQRAAGNETYSRRDFRTSQTDRHHPRQHRQSSRRRRRRQTSLSLDFGFDTRRTVDAAENLSFIRSQNIQQSNINSPSEGSFYSGFQPGSTRTAAGSNSGENAEDKRSSPSDSKLTVPLLLLEMSPVTSELTAKKQEFQTRFRLPNVTESRLDFVRSGSYQLPPYRMPKKHDYRGYPRIETLGLPEFTTAYERDPFNIRFLSEHRQTIFLKTYDATSYDSTKTTISPSVAPPAEDEKLSPTFRLN